MIDPSDPSSDTVEEVDPFFEDSRRYLLYGGLAAFSTDVAVLVIIFMDVLANIPATEALLPTHYTAATIELSRL